MSEDKIKTIRDILKSLPDEIKELAKDLPPKYVQAANFYLCGSNMVNACIRARIIKTTDSEQAKRIKASNVINHGVVSEYRQAVQNYQCSETVMNLHEIDIRLSAIARTDITEIVSYVSEPVMGQNAQGEDILVGYRTRPYLVPIEQLSANQRNSIKGIKQSKTGLEVEMHCAVKAMDMLIKRKGGYTENVNTNAVEKTVHAFMPGNNRGPNSKPSE